MKNCINNTEIVLNNKNNLLDYLYIDEVVVVLRKFLYLKPISGIYNVGSGKPIKSIEIIKEVEKYFKKKIPIKYKINKTKDLYFWASTKKSEKNLKWKIKINFHLAIKKIIKLYAQKYKN